MARVLAGSAVWVAVASLLALQSLAGPASVLCWTTCLGASGPLLVAWCALFCAGAACFMDGTQIQLCGGSSGVRNTVSVEDVKIGDEVLSLDVDSVAGQVCRRVVSNVRHSGQKLGIRLTVEQNVTGRPRKMDVTVTDDHVMLARASRGEPLFAVPAADLVVGDMVKTPSGEAVVAQLDEVQLEHWNHLVTNDGTVLANGVFTSTMCSDSADFTMGKHHAHDMLTAWRNDHAPMMKFSLMNGMHVVPHRESGQVKRTRDSAAKTEFPRMNGTSVVHAEEIANTKDADLVFERKFDHSVSGSDCIPQA